MSITHKNTLGKQIRTSGSRFMKSVAAMIFSTLMAMQVNAQSKKTAQAQPNYGGLKDSLQTYLADCFVKEIMRKNTPEKIRATMTYVYDNTLKEDEAADFLIGELIIKANAENLKCEYENEDSAADKKRLLRSIRAVTNPTTEDSMAAGSDTTSSRDTAVAQTSKPAAQATSKKNVAPAVSGEKVSIPTKAVENNIKMVDPNISGEEKRAEKAPSKTSESPDLFIAKFQEIINKESDKIKACRDMQDFINANADKLEQGLPAGGEADVLRQATIAEAKQQITTFYNEKIKLLQSAVQINDLFLLERIDFVMGNSGDIQNGPDEVYHFYEGKELAFEHAKRVTSTKQLMAKAFESTGIDIAGKNLNLAKSRFESFGQATYFIMYTNYNYAIFRHGEEILSFANVKEMIRTANLINYLESMGRGNLKNLKSPRPFAVEDHGLGVVDLNTDHLTEATIVTANQMKNIYPFLLGEKIQTIIDSLNHLFEFWSTEPQE